MTVTLAPARNEYTANAGQTIFNYTFKIFEDTDLNVYVTPAGQDANDSTDLTTAYTVSGVGLAAGGSITLTTPASINDLITIVSNVPSSRTTNYQNNGDFRPNTVNPDFDRVVSIAKKVEDLTNRALLSPQSQQGVKPLFLPNPIAQALLRWKNDLSGVENVFFSELSPALVPNDLITLNSTLAAARADTGVLLGQVYIFSDRANGMFDVISGTGSANTWNIIAHDTLNLSFVLRTSTLLIAAQLGVTEALADQQSVWQAMADLKPSQILLPSGDLLFPSSGVTFSTAVLLVGEGGGTAAGSTAKRTNLVHDFVGTFLTIDGSDAINSGAGGGLQRLNIVQRDTTGAVVDTALLLTGTTTDLRTLWFKIRNCNIEHEGGSDQWLNAIDCDGSVVGGADGLRDLWIESGRVVGDIRLNNVFNVFMSLMEGNLGSDIEILGGSANIQINTCNFANVNIDSATGVHVNGGSYTSWSTTANSTNVTMNPNFIAGGPSSFLGSQIFAQYFDDNTNNFHFISNQDNSYISGRDVDAGDSTNLTQWSVGNLGPNQGKIALRYTNAAATGGPLSGLFFDPRNDGDTTTFNGGKLTWSKVPGTNTTQSIWEATGGKVTIHQDGIFQFDIPAQLKSFTLATLPSASGNFKVIGVSDATGGPVPAYSNGTNYLTFSTNAIVS